MLYAILCYASEDVVCAWSKEQDEAVMADIAKVQEKYARAGKLGPVARLLPTTAATTLRKVKGESVVIDGPFAETKEQFLGFYTIDCADLDEAVEIRVWDSSAEVRYMVLPERPSGTEHLGEDDLAALVTRDAMIGVAKVDAPARVF